MATDQPDYKCIIEHERCFIEVCLSVVNKAGKLVPFIFNNVQERYEQVRSNFDFILKSRKLGMSTRIIAGDLWACAFKQNQHAVLLTHTDEAAEKMFSERVIPMLKSSVIPLNYQVKGLQVYFPETNSRYYAGTAGSKKFGRGDDISRWHLSEYAHWTDQTVITAIEEAAVENAVGRIETTANGVNFAALDWKKAESGNSLYKPIFIPWYYDPSYSITGATISNPLDDEKRLIEAFGLSQEQLAWRREKMRTMSQPELFPQEYPSTADEAFLSSGRMVFDWVSLMHHDRKCEDAKLRGNLRDMGESIQLIPNDVGPLKIWENPIPRHGYVIGADVAEGLKDGAYSVAFVLDAGTGRQVAEWHGHIPPDKFGDTLVLLALHYNNALLAPEAWPGPGQVTMARIIQLGYSNYFQRTARTNRTEENQLAGWETTQRTRPQMIHAFGAALRDYDVIVKSKELVAECRAFVYDEGGEMGPSLGCFSDRVMAAGIAWYVSRDIATRAINESPKLKHLENLIARSGAVHIPQWRGPRVGVRNE